MRGSIGLPGWSLHGGGGRGGRGEAASGGGCSEASAQAVLEDLHVRLVLTLDLGWFRSNEV